jgi:hypothetical protein
LQHADERLVASRCGVSLAQGRMEIGGTGDEGAASGGQAVEGYQPSGTTSASEWRTDVCYTYL